MRASEAAWPSFWQSGGAVELAGSTDPRATELERRIVLSHYLTRIHCAGSLPPQETGLMVNSWRGRFHLEMHWWHAAHFALWGRPELLERSLRWVHHRLARRPRHRPLAGLRRARWPKQVGPETVAYIAARLLGDQATHLSGVTYRDHTRQWWTPDLPMVPSNC